MKYSQFGKHGQLTFISLSSDITFHNLKIKKEIIKKKKRHFSNYYPIENIYTIDSMDIWFCFFFFFWMTLNQCTSFRLIDFVSFGHFVTFLHYIGGYGIGYCELHFLSLFPTSRFSNIQILYQDRLRNALIEDCDSLLFTQ